MIAYLLAALLAADVPTAGPPASTSAPMSAQAAFDAASAAREAGRPAEALAIFADLEKRPAVLRNPAVSGTVKIRKGLALAELHRPDEADAALRDGLKLVPETVDTYRGDRFLAHVALARMALANLEYPRAKAELALAEPLATDDNARVPLLILQARATMFDEDDAAVRHAEAALAITARDQTASKTFRAELRTLHARALLNHGRAPEAYAELKKAVAEQGGLDLRVGLSEIVTRSDLAIAALLNGDDEVARKYLAYTGAGRWEKAPFATAVHMGPPDCGGPAKLQPDDVAVVEFNILADGSVGYAQPIYSSRLGAAATEFAQVVGSWSWTPEKAATIPELFRLVTRVELRCSTAAERPSTAGLLGRDLIAWLETIHAPYSDIPGSDAARLKPLKVELARRLAQGATPAAIPILIELGTNEVASDLERQGWLIEARDIAVHNGAPLAARISIEIALANVIKPWKLREAQEQKRQLRELAARPEVQQDARVSATLKLLIAESTATRSAPADARALLEQVTTDSRLPDNAPEKVGAFIRLAAIQADAGDVAAARASYQRTGLSAQQCALLDAQPVLRKTNVSFTDFPMEAMRWGFEGWVKTEFDVLANGHTARQRTIIAYPPFVFRDAGVSVAKKVLYQTSYRPEGDAACTGASTNIRFGSGGDRPNR